jgi:hypothetical protein
MLEIVMCNVPRILRFARKQTLPKMLLGVCQKDSRGIHESETGYLSIKE